MIRGLPTDDHFSNQPVEILRVNGVVHTPMVSRDGKIFGYVLQEAGHDTCYVVLHDGASIRRHPVQVGSWNTQASMSERGDAVFHTAQVYDVGTRLHAVWFDADSARVRRYNGTYRAALAGDRRTLYYSETLVGPGSVNLVRGYLDPGHQLSTWNVIAGVTSYSYYHAALGPSGELYCIRLTGTGTRHVWNQSTGQTLTAGASDYSWPSVQ